MLFLFPFPGLQTSQIPAELILGAFLNRALSLPRGQEVIVLALGATSPSRQAVGSGCCGSPRHARGWSACPLGPSLPPTPDLRVSPEPSPGKPERRGHCCHSLDLKPAVTIPQAAWGWGGCFWGVAQTPPSFAGFTQG